MIQLRGMLLGLVLAVALIGLPAAAQSATVSLTSIAFDEAGGTYRLDVFVGEPEAVGGLRVTLWNEQGVEVQQVTVPLPAARQLVELDAGDLVQGRTYSVEVMLLDIDGTPLLSDQGDPLSDKREFVHGPDPSGVEITGLLFSLDREREVLTIAAETVAGDKIAAYRVVLKDEGTNVAVLTAQFPAIDGPVLPVFLADAPEGAYVVAVQALDGAGAVLAASEDDFAYSHPRPELGELRFRFDDIATTLVVDYQIASGDRVGAYRLTLVDPVSNEIVTVHTEEAGMAPPLDLPLGTLPGGEYDVTVEALGEDAQVLASASGKTAYTPPPPPGFLAVAMEGLRANPWIPIAMGGVAVGVTGALLLRAWLENRVTGTPVLQHEGVRASRSEPLPINRTVVAKTALQASHGWAAPGGTAQPPHLVLILEAYPDEGRVGEEIRVSRFPYAIGRGDCDLSLSDDPGVSRHHAELRFSQRGLYIIDLLSANGTYVDGVRIAAETPHGLDPGKPAEIQLGQRTRLRLAKSV